MSGLVLGVDIGVVGAIAVLSHAGELVPVHDMPVLADGPAGRRSVNPPLLAEIICKSTATAAYVEYVSARPKEGAVGAFAFGRSRGVIEGVLAAAGLPVAFLTPPAWKRLVAIRRWPDKAALFARVRDDGRAEAALIAVAGLAREARR
jgi:crossover junction endodeoxyribonuclease RuvC